MFTPFTYDAAGEARKAIILAISSGFPKRFIGILSLIWSLTYCGSLLIDDAVCFTSSSSRCVSVSPGRILLTVILYCPISLASVFDQAATASRMVLETPRLGKGVLTEVEMILMILPYPASHMPVTTACTRIWLQIRC